ncbi:MAG: PIN domain-containing protein [Verrucomicrobia bacterium]|nr:PIN domain-containing protein [Verrucomicrobiota bacterium]MBU1909410.1 PIN domain-containing protein [Verrucomicrobiota bacterium]
MRIYLDSSVFGGCFDEEFAKESLRLVAEIKAGKFRLVMSETVLAELESAPAHVQNALADIPKEFIETVASNPEVEALQQAYLEAKIVGPASAADAEHIAIATVARADMIVSWNFKHIVHYEKIAGYLSVNLRLGYGSIGIYSPQEVVSHENEDI